MKAPSEPDIWRAANALIEQHGDTAGLVAAQKAALRAEQQDLKGAVVWRRVVGAIAQLQSTGQRRTKH